MKNRIYKIYKLIYQSIKNPNKIFLYLELYKISERKRYTSFNTKILGKNIKVIDSNSFISSYREIFENEIYKFISKNENPLIIDCGANIGLSVIYFKKLYPKSKIIAFEPDEHIFKILEKNISTFSFNDVQLINKGLSNKEGQINFYSEGSDGGRIALENDNSNIVKITTTRLLNYINQPVDFLKIDIEGSESEVLLDSSNLLKNVKNLFLEYHSFVNKEQELEKILLTLKNAGFRYYIHPSGKISRNPFISVDTNLSMDLQLNIFAYRL